MRIFFSYLFFACIAGAMITSCAPAIRPGSSSPYQQDLSKVRPRYQFNDDDVLVKGSTPAASTADAPVSSSKTAEEAASVNKELGEIIQTINQQNKSVRYMPGYRIQLYVGNIRSEADAAKSFIYRSFPELSPYITFNQPTYRVKAGDFMSKTEAEHVLASVKLQYASAVIVPDKIEIEKGLLQAMDDR